MRFLDLDCLGRSRPLIGNALLAAGAIAALAATFAYGDAEEAERHWAGRLETARLRTEENIAPGPGETMPADLKAALAVAGELRQPWPALLTGLEQARTDQIALLALDIDAGRRIVRIDGEARERDAIVAFVKRLGRSGVLRNVFLVEDRIRQDGAATYRFLVSAEWTNPT